MFRKIMFISLTKATGFWLSEAIRYFLFEMPRRGGIYQSSSDIQSMFQVSCFFVWYEVWLEQPLTDFYLCPQTHAHTLQTLEPRFHPDCSSNVPVVICEYQHSRRAQCCAIYYCIYTTYHQHRAVITTDKDIKRPHGSDILNCPPVLLHENKWLFMFRYYMEIDSSWLHMPATSARSISVSICRQFF